ncbi:unnamed protein product [Dovyalis caffra]|uniref:Uncharacterized protein n=1 Tax=Dovyalis caffra TaxID=77055 RepID=A0AAV1S551_9ROSI|nr:unnamed protein product [Dovyalis caffra]
MGPEEKNRGHAGPWGLEKLQKGRCAETSTSDSYPTAIEASTEAKQTILFVKLDCGSRLKYFGCEVGLTDFDRLDRLFRDSSPT